MDIVAREIWPLLAGAIYTGFSLSVSTHIVLYKRDVRAAIAWIGLVWLVPLIGPVLYILFGVNRIKRRASLLRKDIPAAAGNRTAISRSSPPCEKIEVGNIYEKFGSELAMLERYVTRITHSPLTYGNRVRMLRNGDVAYPEMLSAINDAKKSIVLSTFIFDNDKSGKEFVAALAAASQRGVAVRVLVDGVGARYSRPRITGWLRENGVMAHEFMRPILPWRSRYMNLRNHRKILAVDGEIGFSGGLNIRDACVLKLKPGHPVQDIHFRFQGPVVQSFMQSFSDDWCFVSKEYLDGEQWRPAANRAGNVAARGIPDGPDEDFETIRWTLMGALSCARQFVKIQTPYFLPDQALLTALGIAATRGVVVDIVLPGKNNLRFVQWAAMAQLWQVLEHGCRVWLAEPPFDHSKLMVVDNAWSLVGSANWDPRSLRLNFEFNVECYDTELASQLGQHVDEIIENATQVTMEDINNRSVPVRLRDGVARLFSPYL